MAIDQGGAEALLGRGDALLQDGQSIGHAHRISEIRDYSDNPWGFVGWDGSPWRIAKAADGWGITLDPDQRFEVL